MTPWGSEWGRYRLPDGRVVSMQRRTIRVRFFDEAGKQVGPELPNVAPAIAYAASQSWWDLDAPGWLNIGIINEVAANITHRRAKA